MNKVILSGNLCKDIELRATPSGNYVVQNTIAVKNDFKNKDGNYDSQFINIVIWNSQAEFISKYAFKGTKLLVEGRLTNRTYDKQDGSKGYASEVVVNNVEILSTPAKKEEVEVPQNIKTEYQEDAIVLTDADLPF